MSPADEERAAQIQSIEVEHTVCFGTCPAYSYRFLRGDSATYTGFHFVSDSGVRHSPLPPGLFDSLALRVAIARLDTLAPRPPVMMVDVPFVYVRVAMRDTALILQRIPGQLEKEPQLDGLIGRLDSTGASLFRHQIGSP